MNNSSQHDTSPIMTNEEFERLAGAAVVALGDLPEIDVDLATDKEIEEYESLSRHYMEKYRSSVAPIVERRKNGIADVVLRKREGDDTPIAPIYFMFGALGSA